MIKRDKKSLILIGFSLFFIFSLLPLKEAKAGVSDNLAGYAWSENIGWISFDSTSTQGCPSVPCEAKFASNEFSGWARACSVFQSGCSGNLSTTTIRGEWEGWIHLKLNSTSSTYGVVLNNNELKGFADGGDVIGWMSFNCTNTGVCATNPYKVGITIPKPSANNLTIDGDNSIDYCFKIVHPPVRFRWSFVGAYAGDAQSAYRIQISTSSVFSSTIEDTTGTIASAYIAQNLS
jgi:hypothetical protein